MTDTTLPAGSPATPGQNETPDPAAPPAPPAQGQTPPWGEDFDPEKAWTLVQNLRGDKDAQKARLDALQAQLDDAKPLLDQAEQLRKANLTEVQAAQERITELEQAATAAGGSATTWRDQAVAAKAEALAAPNFADAAVARQLLGDLNDYVDGDAIDDTKLSSALTALLENHPYLARSGDGQQQRMNPNPAQGASGAPLPLDEQIRSAQERGDVMASIALKHQKHSQR